MKILVIRFRQMGDAILTTVVLNSLKKEGKLALDDHFTLHITPAEQDAYDQYLKAQGIELNKPILLAGVTAKLDYKTWNEGRMTWTLQQFIQKYPDVQVIFNYAPGKEKENAYRIYEQLGKPKQVRIQVEAKSQRELVALANRVTMYFGNEGGGRHIVHACGKPSFVIVAPTTNKTTWLPQNDVPTDGIAVTDIGGARKSSLKALTDSRNMTSSPKKKYGRDGLDSSSSIRYFS